MGIGAIITTIITDMDIGAIITTIITDGNGNQAIGPGSGIMRLPNRYVLAVS